MLRYLVGGSVGAIALGCWRPKAALSQPTDLENLCSSYPANSRCADYLPGVQALDLAETPIAVDTFLPTLTPDIPTPVKGLPETDLTYLVITAGPAIAPYALQPICTHLGCTVPWNAEQNRFICPCHGSQYDNQGRVLHGPAPRSLPLVTVVVKQNQIRLVDRAPAIDPR
ncbi:Rieske 2Fe-2S domain-containing protein [Nodosilinea nodulosa]|uniref:Rieske 2Fe-2S domain-containing protein n=1 Tax=Nodosilinea nodulosa TaxID=416001 RepID=UPI001CED36FB|nr:Rieske 2Fe-2S domain-containing protein [Nodosilinea nodulosa]